MADPKVKQNSSHFFSRSDETSGSLGSQGNSFLQTLRQAPSCTLARWDAPAEDPVADARYVCWQACSQPQRARPQSAGGATDSALPGEAGVAGIPGTPGFPGTPGLRRGRARVSSLSAPSQVTLSVAMSSTAVLPGGHFCAAEEEGNIHPPCRMAELKKKMIKKRCAKGFMSFFPPFFQPEKKFVPD